MWIFEDSRNTLAFSIRHIKCHKKVRGSVAIWTLLTVERWPVMAVFGGVWWCLGEEVRGSLVSLVSLTFERRADVSRRSSAVEWSCVCICVCVCVCIFICVRFRVRLRLRLRLAPDANRQIYLSSYGAKQRSRPTLAHRSTHPHPHPTPLTPLTPH